MTTKKNIQEIAADAITVEDLRGMYSDYCSGAEIDPAEFLESKEFFRSALEDAFDAFVETQVTRAKRVKRMYAELDKIDYPEMFRMMETFTKREDLVDYFAATLQPFFNLWKRERDGTWIHHPNYKWQLFEFVQQWKKGEYHWQDTLEWIKTVIRNYTS